MFDLFDDSQKGKLSLSRINTASESQLEDNNKPNSYWNLVSRILIRARLNRVAVLLLTMLSVASGQMTNAANAQVNAEEIDQIFSDYSDNPWPCCAVAVYKDGEIIFSTAYGLANLEYNIPNSPDTVFHVASISKQFTAFSILLLEDEGKLSLDDDIRDYLPEMPDFDEKVTIRNLLNHTSGIRDQWDLLTLAGYRADDLKTNDDIYRLLTRQQELNFGPGERYLYSNSGYTLLALIVERLSGQSFREFTQQRIFDPLEMNNTHFNDNYNEVVPNRSYGYVRNSDQSFQRNIPAFNTVGATSLFTTVSDFARWDRNFNEKSVGNMSVFEKLLTRGRLNDGQQISYASGLGITEYRGLKMISHTGADAGYRSTYMRFPESGISIALFANARIDVQRLGLEVAELLLAESFQDPSQEQPVEESRYITISEEVTQNRSGPYRENGSSNVWHIVNRSGTETLLLSANGRNFPLAPIDNNTYVTTDTSAEITATFSNISGERESLHVSIDNEGSFQGAPLPKIQNMSAYAQSFAGTYYSPELDTRFEIEAIDDQLIARHYKMPQFRIMATYEDVLTSESGQLAIVVDRDDAGLISGFRASTGRVIDLKFIKED